MASAYDKCIKQVQKATANVVGHAKAQQILSQVQAAHATNLANNANANLARNATLQQVTGLVNAHGIALAQTRRLAAYQKLKFVEGVSHAKTYKSLTEGWESLYAGVEHFLKGSRDSADSKKSAYLAEVTSFLETRLKQEGVTDAFVTGAGDEHALADFLANQKTPGWHPTTNADPALVKIAKVIGEVYDHMRQEANLQGANIGELMDYMGRQSHDADKMASPKKRSEWITDAGNMFDFDKILGPNPTPQHIETYLNSLYESTVSGVRFEYSGTRVQGFVAGKGMNIANKMGQDRSVFFKSPSDFVNYNQKWGHGSIKSLMVEAMNNYSRQTALLSVTGPKPEQFHDDMWQAMRQEARNRYASDPEKVRKEVEKIDAFHKTKGRYQLDELMASSRGIDSRRMAYLGGEARAFVTLPILGSIPISSLNDLAWIGFDNKFMGDSPIRAFTKPLTDFLRFAKNGDERRWLASETGAVAHMSNDYMSNRVGGETAAGRGVAGKWAHFQHKISGMLFFDKVNRVAMGSQMMARLGDHAKRFANYSEMAKAAPDFTRTLGLYGINEHEWNILRQYVKASPSMGYDYISGRNLDTMTDAHATELMRKNGTLPQKPSSTLLQKTKSNLRLKLFQLIVDRGNYGNFVQTTKEAAAINRGTRRGSFGGEFNRALGMIKSFPLAVYNRGVKRELFGRDVSTQKAVAGLASMVVMMSALGAAQYQLKRVIHGNKVEDLSMKSMMEGITEGGGLGIMTDWLFKDYSEAYGNRSILNSLAGPLIGNAARAVDTLSELRAASYDPTARGQAYNDGIKLVKNMLPYQNLWYASTAFNYYVWYQIEESLHPGILARQEAARQRAGEKGPFIPPSAVHGGLMHPGKTTQMILDYAKNH